MPARRRPATEAASLAVDLFGTHRPVDEFGWHIRVQPCEGLDEDEESRVMTRLAELLQVFVKTDTVHADLAISGSHAQIKAAVQHLVKANPSLQVIASRAAVELER